MLVGGGGQMKGWRVILRRIVSPSFILPKLPSPLVAYSIKPPPPFAKKSEMIAVRSKVSENMLKICEGNRPRVGSLRLLERIVCGGWGEGGRSDGSGRVEWTGGV